MAWIAGFIVLAVNCYVSYKAAVYVSEKVNVRERFEYSLWVVVLMLTFFIVTCAETWMVIHSINN